MKKFRITLYPKSDLELTWLVHKEYFDLESPRYRTCMRCGRQMRKPLAENALSRAMNVYICPECGEEIPASYLFAGFYKEDKKFEIIYGELFEM